MPNPDAPKSMSADQFMEQHGHTAHREVNLRKELQAKSRHISALQHQLGSIEELFEQIRDHVIAFTEPKLVYKAPSERSTHTITPVLQLSDWHIGQDIDPIEVEGFNEFNWDVAKNRVAALNQRFISDFIEPKRSNARVDELVILCQGDFISGAIHQELAESEEFYVPEQVVHAANLLAACIRDISVFFAKVRVEFVVPDNHSRTTIKNAFKGAALSSNNYLVGKLTEAYLAQIKNVTINIRLPIKSIMRVYDRSYLVGHGHTIKCHMGFPWYGADRETGKEAKARRHTDHQMHRMIIGHFHVPMNTQDWMINGSLTGTTEFDHGCGRHAPPSQCAFFVHPEYGDIDWNAFILS